MPVLIAVTTLLDVLMIAHVMRSRRDTYWVYIILAIPIFGAGVYFFLEFLPEFRQSRLGKKTVSKVRQAIDPDRDLKDLAKNLATSDNIDNKLKLADECVTRGLYAEAVELYQNCLTAQYATDPHIMLKLASAQFYQEDYAAAKQTLDKLIAENPDFKSPQGHMLYARILEALAENDQALEEYQVLVGYFSGLEAQCRYALFLQKLGRTEKAQQLFNEIIQKGKDMPSGYRKNNKAWLEIAKQQV